MSDLGDRRRRARIESARKTSARMDERQSLRQEMSFAVSNACRVADEEKEDRNFDMMALYANLKAPKPSR